MTDISWIQKDVQCWIYLPLEQKGPIFIKGIIRSINPLTFNQGNSKVVCILQNGSMLETKAANLQKRRHSNSLEKDLISLQIINPAQILVQLKRRFQQKKIHTYMWNSLIIANPFVRIEGMYDEKVMKSFYDRVIYNRKELYEVQPHIYGFVCNILNNMKISQKIQMISISGESGSGKTQTNKQCLKIISFICQNNIKTTQVIPSFLIEERILNCDNILECFGNAKTSKNDNSSRFGKLMTEKINTKDMQILNCEVKVYFLQKSRIIHQNHSQRNFHIFYQLLMYCPQNLKSSLGLKSKGGSEMTVRDFNYISSKTINAREEDKIMWNGLLASFKALDISQSQRNHIFQIVAAVLHLGNIQFDSTTLTNSDPCDISNQHLVSVLAGLLMIDEKLLKQVLVFHKKQIAGEILYLPMTQKQCEQGRDSMAKAIYENLFLWIVEQLNKKVNESQKPQKHVKIIKMLDIYGFEVFQHNSFQQLCVNYTNERIHQIYLDQVFKNEKALLKKQGLENIITSLKFTDNAKIIQLLDTSLKSVYNLLDQSCYLNVKDDDFLSNLKKFADGHQNFPPSNNVTLKKCFVIRHTPGDIQYMANGFRNKNKDFVRQDIIQKLSNSKSLIINSKFSLMFQSLKSEQNKKFLGFKIRKQVAALMTEMSSNADMHFIRCIKPNQEKLPLTFVDRVCYNQIKYLGILDTVRMRKDCYHVRLPYFNFYQKYGILKGDIKEMIKVKERLFSDKQCKQMTMGLFQKQFKGKNLDYLFGTDKIFMKMQTNSYLEALLKMRTKKISHSSTVIKVMWRKQYMKKQREKIKMHLHTIQSSIKAFLLSLSIIKKKRAVAVIEREWIINCKSYFKLKRRIPLISVQKYIKTIISKRDCEQKYNSILFARDMINSMRKVHKQAKQFQDFQAMKKFVSLDIYDLIWKKMTQHNVQKIQRYLKQHIAQSKNRIKVASAFQRSHNRQMLRNIKTIQKYFKVVQYSKNFEILHNDVVLVQKCARMAIIRKKYNKLREKVIRIQRAWRSYKYDKQHNTDFTKKYFDDNSELDKQWRLKLYRNLRSHNFNKQHHGFQGLLEKFQKIKKDKIILFYYLLDFQIFCHDPSIQKWVENYLQLSEDSLIKLNPIQFIDVSNTHTAAATTSKFYTWGDISKSTSMQEFQINHGKIQKVVAEQFVTRVDTINPTHQHFIGSEKKINENEKYINKQWATLNHNFVLLNGIVLTMHNVSFTKLNMPQKVSQISCGMQHVICKTILKKVFTWGKNASGQLGTGDFFETNSTNPRHVDFFYKRRIPVVQVAASPQSSIVIDINNKIYWFGSNGTIKNVCSPEQMHLTSKSLFISNHNKYSCVRIITRWSKNISLIGATIACHDDILKNQISLRRKILQSLMTKWNDDINTINPPYSQTVADYISERHMPLPTVHNDSNRGLSNKEIRQKIISDIHKIQQAEKDLLTTKKIGQKR